MINIGIYKITNPSGKVYIGQSIDINNRKSKYKTLKCTEQPIIYNSLLKYGWDKHKFEIIEKCSKQQLKIREVYWKLYFIKLLGKRNVLFCEVYDVGTYGPLSNKTKLKISNSKKGSKYGPMKDSTKIKLRKAALKRKKGGVKGNNFRSKPIIQIDKNQNRSEFKSVKEASRITKINFCSIQQTATGKQKTAGGYKWEYK